MSDFPGRSAGRRALVVAAATLVAGACDDGTGPGDGLRFGARGEVRVELVSPKLQGEGELRQTVTWTSSGAWRLTETLSYRGTIGERQDTTSIGDGSQHALDYARWVTLVNDATQGIQLVGYEPLDENLEPECGAFRTRVTVAITDEVHETTRDWTRCAETGLENLDPRGSGPDPAAGRVVQAAQLVRDLTVGAARPFQSSYAGSLPFATLLRGGDLTEEVPDGGVIRDADTWETFWRSVDGSGTTAPDVDFDTQLVLVGVLGQREEAGDSLEVRRVLPVEFGTRVELVERIAGDFCSPAELRHTPFHVVVAPAVPDPVRFTRLPVERVACPR